MEDYKKKYEDALNAARKFKDDCPLFWDTKSNPFKDVFEELKESDDERIRKEIIDYLNREITLSNFGGDIATFKKWIAWLERVGKHNEQNFWEKCKHCEYFDGYDLCLHKKNFGAVTDESKENCKNNNFFIEKQGEQNPTDIVEQKFKVGDWIVTPSNETKQIEKVTFGNYYFTDKTLYNIIDIDNNAYIWTIQDAKEGDVLCCENGWTCIFKSLDSNSFSSYCFMDCSEWFCELGGECHSLNKNLCGKIHPATKEQRDILFQRMKEAGYEWDHEKKELRKIEQKPVWSEEDENMKELIIKTLTSMGNLNLKNYHNMNIEEVAEWFKSLKERMNGE